MRIGCQFVFELILRPDPITEQKKLYLFIVCSKSVALIDVEDGDNDDCNGNEFRFWSENFLSVCVFVTFFYIEHSIAIFFSLSKCYSTISIKCFSSNGRPALELFISSD